MADINIVFDILTKMKAVHPTSTFITSLYNQYCIRGGLSKKQLEGLLDKAQKTPEIAQGKIATLEAIILKKITRDRTKPTPPPWFVTHETKTRQSLLPSLVAAHAAKPRLGLRPADKVATK